MSTYLLKYIRCQLYRLEKWLVESSKSLINITILQYIKLIY